MSDEKHESDNDKGKESKKESLPEPREGHRIQEAQQLPEPREGHHVQGDVQLPEPREGESAQKTEEE